MYFLLSPAKSLNETDQPTTTVYSQPALLAQAEQLMSVLREQSPNDLQQLMNISEDLAMLNKQRNDEWHTPFTPDNAKQAVFLFDGDVYTGIDAYNLSDDALEYLQEHVGLLSGLYGILRPLDLIQPYRLEMGTKLANPSGKDLYAYWGKQISSEINQRMAGDDEPLLINLASNEYFKSVDKKTLRAKIITPRFEDEKNGKYKVISFYAKKARGMMVRYAANQRITHPEKLQGFDLAGYRFCADASDDKTWVFRRPQAAQ